MASEMQRVLVAQASQKSAGLAWMLNLLFLGAGNLYAGAIVTGLLGLAILALMFLLVLITAGFGVIIAAPVWLLCWILFSLLAQRKIKKKNLRSIEGAFAE